MLPALLALTLGGLTLTAAPTHAQWVADHSTNTFPQTTQGYNSTSSPSPAASGTVGASSYGYTSPPGYTSDAGAVTLTFRWTGAQGQTVTPLYVLLSGSANLGGYNPQPGGPTVADGLGDGMVSQPLPEGYSASGTHLVQKAAPSGAGPGTLLSLDAVTLTASGTNGFAGLSLSGTVDSRAVSISCPMVDGTNGSCYKSPPITGQLIYNVRQSDGTMRGDTVKPPSSAVRSGGSESLTYQANVGGTWNADSSFLWNSSLTSNNISGTFSLPEDPVSAFTTAYPSTSFTYGSSASPGEDHVYLHLTAYNDGANATSNYYMYFHDQWEPANWPADGGTYKVMGPDPEAPSWPVYAWQAPSPATTISYPSGMGVNFSYQEPGFESYDGGLDLGIDPVTAHFGATYKPGPEITQTAVLTPNPALGYNQMTWAVYRENVSRTKGHLDEYGTNGYIGLGVWRDDKLTAIDTGLYFPYASTGSPVTNPPTGWNPPGYN